MRQTLSHPSDFASCRPAPIRRIHARFGLAIAGAGLLAGLAAGGPAAAIAKYRSVPLPDAGRGSAATAIATAPDSSRAAVGARREADGTTSATIWGVAAGNLTGDGPADIVTRALPKPARSNAEASAVAIADGSVRLAVVAGNYIGTDAVAPRPVLWVPNAQGSFSLLPLDEAPGRATGVALRNTAGGLIIVVCGQYRQPGGEWHACLWTVGPNGRQRTDLGTLGGVGSEAIALLSGGGALDWFVVGRAAKKDGRTVAALWTTRLMEEEGIFYFTVRALPTPSGALSRGVALAQRGSLLQIGGDVTRSTGVTSGVVWSMLTDGTSNTILVSEIVAPAGNSHSAVTSLLATGDAGNGVSVGANQTVTVGSSWNDAGDRSASAALVSPGTSKPGAFPFSDLTVENDSAVWLGLNAIAQDGAMAGRGTVPGSATAQAMVAVPSGPAVSNIIGVLIGLLVDRGAGSATTNLTALWKEDGRALRISPKRVGTEAYYKITFEEVYISSLATGSRTPGRLSIVGQVAPRVAGGSATCAAEVELLDAARGEWVTVWTGQFSSRGFQRWDVTVPDPQRFAAANGAPIRARLSVTGAAATAGILSIDLFEMETE